MKNIVFYLFFILFSTGQSQHDLLTNYKWKIEKISNSELKGLFPENLDYGEPWIFKKDGRVIIHDKYVLGGGITEGVWSLKDQELMITIRELDLKFKIIELNTSKLKLRLNFDNREDLDYDFVSVKKE
ncbi:hypothetical protein [Aquimarina algicola]|uniref:Lipocalin-like domain-containing protein n=1 Tax=Aquimarina algicola TaxID=2589995 RepID=A0A504J1B9_9FLAO|nr:hypothetical protein [Aquimarina algicola]TPN84637.1 hypothetical protein FHK87_17050 [Aquimarina algicola]